MSNGQNIDITFTQVYASAFLKPDEYEVELQVGSRIVYPDAPETLEVSYYAEPLIVSELDSTKYVNQYRECTSEDSVTPGEYYCEREETNPFFATREFHSGKNSLQVEVHTVEVSALITALPVTHTCSL